MSVGKSALKFAVGTVLSRLSGLVRDVVVAGLLGAGHLNDAFVIAQRIPNLLRDMLAEGALGSSFTKTYTSLRHNDPDAAETLLFQMIYLGLLFTSLLILAGIVFAPQLVALMSVGSVQDARFSENAEIMTKILFPSLGMSVLGAIAMGALYEKGRFFLNAVIPILANLGVIAGGVALAPLLSHFFPLWAEGLGDPRALGLAWGTLLGFALQMCAALWSVRHTLRLGMKEMLGRIPWSPEIKKVLVLMGPAAIASSAGPINSIVNTNFATDVGPGAVTWLNYAFRILQLPIGIFGVAVGVAALPSLTRAVSRAHKRVNEDVSLQLEQAVSLVTWFLFPCMVYMLVNYELIIRTLFRVGRFTETDVQATGQALFAYSFGLIAYGWIKVFTSFFYAIDKTSYAMRVSLFGIGLNYVGNLMLVHSFGHKGLAFTSSTTLSMNALLLCTGATLNGVRWNGLRVRKDLCALAFAGIISYGVDYAIAHQLKHVEVRWILVLGLAMQGALTALIFGLVALRIYEISFAQMKALVSSKLQRKNIAKK